MPLPRRKALTIAGLAALATALGACAPGLLPGATRPVAWPARDDPAWRLLSRLTLGPTPAERAEVASIGVHAWIEQQLAPEQIDDPVATWHFQPLESLWLDSSAIFDLPGHVVRQELQQAALLRAVYSRRQLFELMVDFWSDHFSIAIFKGDCAWLKTIDDGQVVRAHAMGRFDELLWASMHSPAMLISLDNQANTAAGPNENYARELLELHTLGLDAGYSQQDVRMAARCLTGWTVGTGPFRGQFRFEAAQHDDAPKHVLGVPLPAAGGQADGERLFDLVVAHPATPGFIARKLCRRLVADPPPAALVAAAARTFRHTRGDLRAVLRTILFAPECADAPPRFKRPLGLVAGALRQLGAATDGGPPLLDALARMGQPLFAWPTPDGFPEQDAAWTGTLAMRWRFALGLARGDYPGTHVDLAGLVQAAGVNSMPGLLDQLAVLLIGSRLPHVQRDALVDLLGREVDDEGAQAALAAMLASPHYQWR